MQKCAHSSKVLAAADCVTSFRGRTTHAHACLQVRLLADYIEKLDHIVNKTTHVFISYRVAGGGQETTP